MTPSFVMVGLVPTIQPSTSVGICRSMDPRDKPEDDNGAQGFSLETTS